MAVAGTTLMLLALAAGDAPPQPGATPKEPDYAARFNDRLREGVTAERNANALLWKAYGPAPEGGDGMPPEFFERLGIPAPPKAGDYFIGLGSFARDRLKLTPDETMAFHDEQSQASRRPWAAADYPRLAAWLAANEKPLAIVAEAVARPDYYNPLLTRMTDGKPGSLVGALMPGVQKAREVAAALTARAMLRAGDGKFDNAWRDLVACHRLGRHVARGGTLIQVLVGIAIDQVASTADIAYLERADLPAPRALAYLKEFQSLPPMPSMADTIDVGERAVFLDSLQFIRRGALDEAAGKDRKPTPKEVKAWESLDWSPVVKSGNRWYDRMAAALRLATRAERQAAMDRIDADLKELDVGDKEPPAPAWWFGAADPSPPVVERIGNTLIALTLPAFRKVSDAADRAEQVQRNVSLAFALAAYRRAAGAYPDTLAALTPKYLAAVPADVFTGKNLIYRPAGVSYELYSVGANGRDEGGRGRDDDPAGDDIRVRVPQPAAKMPN